MNRSATMSVAVRRMLVPAFGLSIALAFLSLLAFSTPVLAAPVVQPFSGSGATVFVHRAIAANVAGDWTDLDNPVINGHPRAIIEVTPNWNPDGSGGVYNNHAIGVWYHSGKWAIFNQDGQPIPVGAAFNVYALPNDIYSGVLVHQATSFTITGNFTDIDSSYTNNQPGASLFVTPNWNPGGVGGVYDNHPIGVWYHSGKWAIFNQDGQPIPVGASFNVIALSHVSGLFKHTATIQNSQGDWTNLNSHTADNNPRALVFVTPVYNPYNVYENHNLGVWYTFDHHWAIFDQDLQAVPAGASFNVLVFKQPI